MVNETESKAEVMTEDKARVIFSVPFLRVKTERELKEEFGDDWTDGNETGMDWSRENMDNLFGKQISPDGASFGSCGNSSNLAKMSYFTCEGKTISWTLSEAHVTNKPLPKDEVFYASYVRVKTKEELVAEFGVNWRSRSNTSGISFDVEMDYLLGQQITCDNDSRFDHDDDSMCKYTVVSSGKKEILWWLSYKHVTTNPLPKTSTPTSTPTSTDTSNITQNTTQPMISNYTPSKIKYDWRFITRRELEESSTIPSGVKSDLLSLKSNCLGRTIEKCSPPSETSIIQVNTDIAACVVSIDRINTYLHFTSKDGGRDDWSFIKDDVKHIVTTQPLNIYDDPDTRFKTEDEFKRDYGSNWRDIQSPRIKFDYSKDRLFGKKLSDFKFAIFGDATPLDRPKIDEDGDIKIIYKEPNGLINSCYIHSSWLTAKPLPVETSNTQSNTQSSAQPDATMVKSTTPKMTIEQMMAQTWYVKSPKRLLECARIGGHSAITSDPTHALLLHGGVIIDGSSTSRNLKDILERKLNGSQDTDTKALNVKHNDGSRDWWYFLASYLTTDITETTDDPIPSTSATNAPVKKEKVKPTKTTPNAEFVDTMILCNTKSQMNRVYNHLKARTEFPYISPNIDVVLYDIYNNTCEFGYSSFKDNGDKYCIWLIGKSATTPNQVIITRDARKSRYSAIPKRPHRTMSYEDYMGEETLAQVRIENETHIDTPVGQCDIGGISLDEIRRVGATELITCDPILSDKMQAEVTEQTIKEEPVKSATKPDTVSAKPTGKQNSKPATVFNADEW